ncbi:cysteine desulfurase family protein [Bacillus benzoevorans]|uniref:cysteine desulfurase n=1 Tax=Bacillus benzoevorans TaxID=1456 RepID=A0A7X0HSD6_9BACI|nr:cysteine desulfurase family protein [Bacillus benzoevorans]MBB6445921.1 cysteine desulfurase [Bacillus benzoevorans]
MERIYVDHAATTPMHPAVIEKITQTMKDIFGNPSSIHSFGREARKIVDEARFGIAKSIGADEAEIVFTSGGTEADNFAIFGAAEVNIHKGNHIITTQVEHHAVLHACHELEKRGYEVTYLPVDETGAISLADFSQALRDETILVTIMYGNNEVGTIQPIAEIGELLAGHQALFHTDAVQAYGVEKLDVHELKVDLLSASAHKINGPKGIGFLYVKSGLKLSPRLYGGEQERKRRAGTENVPAIAGFFTAAQIAGEQLHAKKQQLSQFKQILLGELEAGNAAFHLNGTLEKSLPHVINISFPGTNVEALLVNLDLAGIAASSGSACTAGSVEPSHVLVAMFGEDREELTNSIRFSFGMDNTEEQIKQVGEEMVKIVRRLTKK